MANQGLCEDVPNSSVPAVLSEKKIFRLESGHCQNGTLSAVYKEQDKVQVILEETSSCSICMEPHMSSLTVLQCGHMFHSKCEEKWRENSRTCPFCREEISFYSHVNDVWAHSVSRMTVASLKDVMELAKLAMNECNVCKEKETPAGDFVVCDHFVLAFS